MVVNPLIKLPDGYIAIDMANLEWQYLSTRHYFNVNSARLGIDISTIDTNSIRCGKYTYVGLVADTEVVPEMNFELSIYRNLAGVRVVDRRYNTVNGFMSELGDSCYMIFRLLN